MRSIEECALYHSSIANSGACRAVRCRLRKTLVKETICSSPAVKSFFIANSGEVCRYASCSDPSDKMSAVLNPCKCVSFPGETWRAAGCTSMNPSARNQRRRKVETCARASSPSRRSAYRTGFQKAPAAGVFKRNREAKRDRTEVGHDWSSAQKLVCMAS
jgi:hypothetical protein